MKERAVNVEALDADNFQFDTTCSLVGLGVEDIEDLASGYVNLKVRSMARLLLSSEDQDRRRAERPVRKAKK